MQSCIILQPKVARPVLCTYMQYSIVFSSLVEVASDVIPARCDLAVLCLTWNLEFSQTVLATFDSTWEQWH